MRKQNFKFSEKMSGLKPSLVREILKAASVPGTVAFAAGNPAPEAFPFAQLRSIAAEIFEEEPVTALQYGVTEGYTPLRELLKSYLKEKHSIGGEGDSLIITSGAQQVMDLTTKVLCNEGDTVLCENPSFIGSLNCFRAYGARLRGIPLCDDGIDTEELEKALLSDREDRRVRFLYTIPNFQNPSGITMSEEKRRAVYELACKYDLIILEDNPYGDLRVSGRELPSIKSMDEEGRVIYAGTFSKLIAPGLRVGYVSAPSELTARMTVGKQTSDVHTPMLCQLLVYRWLKECDTDAHIRRMREIYSKKMELMCGLIDSCLSPYVDYVRPEGGLFIWCRLRSDIDMPSFCALAAERGVAVVPGNAFLVDESERTQYIRLNFSTPSDEDIERGMKILGEIAAERYSK